MYYYQSPNNAGPASNYMGLASQAFGLKGRPVSSLEEVRAAQIDFDGSLFVFPDIANQRIYTKQINLDGTASLNMYVLTPIPQSTTGNSNYVTREELKDAMNELKSSLNKPIEQIASSESAQAKPAQNFNF